MVFIWRGFGFLAAVLGIGSLIAAQSIVNAAFGDARYYATHEWPKLAGGWTGSALVWVVGRRLNRGMDPAFHTFFWIPMEYWGLILAVACALLSAFSR